MMESATAKGKTGRPEGREEVAYFSLPITRATNGHLLAKHSQRPRPRLGVPGETLWFRAEVSEGKEKI